MICSSRTDVITSLEILSHYADEAIIVAEVYLRPQGMQLNLSW